MTSGKPIINPDLTKRERFWLAANITLIAAALVALGAHLS